jgi:hypothetical protein
LLVCHRCSGRGMHGMVLSSVTSNTEGSRGAWAWQRPRTTDSSPSSPTRRSPQQAIESSAVHPATPALPSSVWWQVPPSDASSTGAADRSVPQRPARMSLGGVRPTAPRTSSASPSGGRSRPSTKSATDAMGPTGQLRSEPRDTFRPQPVSARHAPGCDSRFRTREPTVPRTTRTGAAALVRGQREARRWQLRRRRRSWPGGLHAGCFTNLEPRARDGRCRPRNRAGVLLRARGAGRRVRCHVSHIPRAVPRRDGVRRHGDLALTAAGWPRAGRLDGSGGRSPPRRASRRRITLSFQLLEKFSAFFSWRCRERPPGSDWEVKQRGRDEVASRGGRVVPELRGLFSAAPERQGA